MMNPLYEGTPNGFMILETAAFAVDNFDAGVGNFTSAPYGVSGDPLITPNGALAGSVACLKGNLIVGLATTPAEANKALGFFCTNANGDSLRSVSAVASHRLAFWQDGGVYETDLYELKSFAGATLTYAAGDPLYCSRRSFITKDNDAGAVTRVIGEVLSPPDANGKMRVQLRIIS